MFLLIFLLSNGDVFVFVVVVVVAVVAPSDGDRAGAKEDVVDPTLFESDRIPKELDLDVRPTVDISFVIALGDDALHDAVVVVVVTTIMASL